jgi:hypothetical protein
VFDRLAALVENVWPLRYAGLLSIQYGLVLETGYGAELIARALRPDRAVSAGLAVTVIDLLQAATSIFGVLIVKSQIPIRSIAASSATVTNFIPKVAVSQARFDPSRTDGSPPVLLPMSSEQNKSML